MDKRKLRGIKVDRITEEELNELMNIRGTKAKWIVDANITEIDNKKAIVLDIYRIKSIENMYAKYWPVELPNFRLYMNNDDYITYDYVEDKWRTGTLESVMDLYYSGDFYYDNKEWHQWNEVVIISEGAKIGIENYINEKIEHSFVYKLYKKQREIMDAKLKMRHKKITDRIDKRLDGIDKRLDGIEDIPVDFEEWLESTAFYNSKYIYYEYSSSKHKVAHCTHCKKEFKSSEVRYNKKMKCPCCGEICICKSIKKTGRIQDECNVALLQRFGDESILREFSCKKIYKSYDEIEIFYYEIKRIIMKNDTSIKNNEIYEYTEFKQTGKNRWCDNAGRWYTNYLCLYERNIEEVVKDTVFKNSGIFEFATLDKGIKFNVYKYLTQYLSNNSIEKISKIGLLRLNTELLDKGYGGTDYNKTKAAEILKIDNNLIKILREINGGIKALEVLQDIKKENKYITAEQVKFIEDNDIVWGSMKNIAKYMTISKAIKYLTKQLEIQKVTREKITIRNLIIDWKDYIEDCEKLKFNLRNDFVLFPKDLIKRHRETSEMVKVENEKEITKNIKKLKEKIGSNYEFEDKEFKVIFPSDASQIRKEGQDLKHCVGGYAERFSKGETIILFVRHKEELLKSYYTMEVSLKNTIVQCRGKSNCSYEDDKKLKRFITKYKNQILKNNLKIGA